MYIPDPTELMESRIACFNDRYIDEYTCMQCGKKVDYDLICMSPVGDGPAVCCECAGFDPDKIKEYDSQIINNCEHKNTKPAQ
jgi:hypothetical protein